MTNSEKIRVGSKMSYLGALDVIAWKEIARTGGRGHGWMAALTWTGAGLLALADVVLLMVLWVLVTMWYVLIFGVFGLITFPWRLHMRSQRRQAATQAAMLAEMRKRNA